MWHERILHICFARVLTQDFRMHGFSPNNQLDAHNTNTCNATWFITVSYNRSFFYKMVAKLQIHVFHDVACLMQLLLYLVISLPGWKSTTEKSVSRVKTTREAVSRWPWIRLVVKLVLMCRVTLKPCICLFLCVSHMHNPE